MAHADTMQAMARKREPGMVEIRDLELAHLTRVEIAARRFVEAWRSKDYKRRAACLYALERLVDGDPGAPAFLAKLARDGRWGDV